MVIGRAPKGTIASAVHGDYPSKQFNVKFWIDSTDRIRRVIASYVSAQGTPVAIDASYSGFGATVDTTPPPARSVKDVTPKR